MSVSPSNGNDAASSTECMWCSDANADVVFRPCMHRIACVPCSVRTKKCILCHTVITAKVGPGKTQYIRLSLDYGFFVKRHEAIKLYWKMFEPHSVLSSGVVTTIDWEMTLNEACGMKLNI
jgi:Zinc finger, C3HC4 type (RING finger)